MSEANKALVRRWFEEVWNQGREKTIDELFAADGVAHGLGDTEADTRGPEGFKPFFRNLRGSFPDLHMTVEDAIAEGDKVTVRLLVKGTQPYRSLSGDALTASGRVLHSIGRQSPCSCCKIIKEPCLGYRS